MMESNSSVVLQFIEKVLNRGEVDAAGEFFWEDMVSMLVLALHTAYLVALATGALPTRALMWLALAAYAAYVINATQFVLKLRAARLGRASADATMLPAGASS